MLRLTATELSRFMACNGSKMLGGIPPFDTSTEQADEGNAAHWLCEQVAKGANPENLINQKAPNGLFITADMVEFCKPYLDFVTSGNIEVETDTSYSGNNWEVHGRADSIKFSTDNNGTLTIADLKYGWRIISPEMNWTLISHAIGWWHKHSATYIENFKFIIFQPRPFHPEGTIRVWEIKLKDFDKICKELFSTLENPQAKVCTTAHCQHCECFSQCPAAQVSIMNAIDVAEKAFDSEISDDKLSWMLKNLKRAQEVLKQAYTAYEDLAFHRLKAGKHINGYTMQTSLGQTAWNKDVTADFIKSMTGIDVTVQKLMTPAQARKAGLPEEFVCSCTHRPENGFKLVEQDEQKLAEKLFGKKEK